MFKQMKNLYGVVTEQEKRQIGPVVYNNHQITHTRPQAHASVINLHSCLESPLTPLHSSAGKRTVFQLMKTLYGVVTEEEARLHRASSPLK